MTASSASSGSSTFSRIDRYDHSPDKIISTDSSLPSTTSQRPLLNGRTSPPLQVFFAAQTPQDPSLDTTSTSSTDHSAPMSANTLADLLTASNAVPLELQYPAPSAPTPPLPVTPPPSPVASTSSTRAERASSVSSPGSPHQEEGEVPSGPALEEPSPLRPPPFTPAADRTHVTRASQVSPTLRVQSLENEITRLLHLNIFCRDILCRKVGMHKWCPESKHYFLYALAFFPDHLLVYHLMYTESPHNKYLRDVFTLPYANLILIFTLLAVVVDR